MRCFEEVDVVKWDVGIVNRGGNIMDLFAGW